jgi:phosphoribosylformylglycinamidine (FGAM) synthase-like amidotransferase family enzyme
MRGRPVNVCVITGYGVNADEELETAFRMAGADACRVHVADLLEEPGRLLSYRILAFPGGFSFGDHLGSGKVFALLFARGLKEELERFISAGGLVIGICNGFQTLVKMGILPNLDGGFRQEVSLIHNESGKFEDRWVRLAFDPQSPCLWTRGLLPMDLQVRHGEGRFVVKSPEVLEAIEAGRLAAARYVTRNGSPAVYPANPNGSVAAIAGICDKSGRVFGLMPHPEAFLFPQTHPGWHRGEEDACSPAAGGKKELPPGLLILRAGVLAAGDGM